MKTYTYGQIQIVRDALELAHDTSYDGENNRKIRGAIELLDTPLDAFKEVYRLKDEVERLTAERDALRAEHQQTIYANQCLVAALDRIHDVLNGVYVDDVAGIVNRALAANTPPL